MKPFLPSPNRSTEQGTSLIELIIAASVLAVIIYFITNFLNQSQQSTVRFEARAHADQFNQETIRRLEAAFHHRAIAGSNRSSGFHISNQGLRLQIDRQRQDNLALSYATVFETRCDPIPSDLSSDTELARARFRSEPGNNRTGSCLDLANCPRGTFPQVRISHTGQHAPNATVQVYPTEASLYSQRNPIGHCLSANQINNPSGINILIDTVLIDERNTSNLIQIITQDRILRLNNTSNVRLLP